MALIKIDPDYVNYKFNIWKNGQFFESRLPAEVQKAIMEKVIEDCCIVFNQVLRNQMSKVPADLELIIYH